MCPRGFTEVWEEGGKTFLSAPIADGHMASLAAPAPQEVHGDPLASLQRHVDSSEWILPKLVANLDDPSAIFHDRLCQVRAPTWVKGHVVLIGDAAHALHPIMGMGASLALEDAQALAESLREKPLPAALHRYADERKARVVAVRREAAVVAAASVFPQPAQLAQGFVPGLPQELDWGEVLPWIGFALSGAAGMMWYSYWLPAKGYGAAGRETPVDHPDDLSEEDRTRLRGWLGQLTLDNSIAVVGTFVIMLAFLILGTELLKPQGLVPKETEMARTLGEMLRGVWGPFGFYFMIAGVLIGFWSTVLSDQDGFRRLFANGTRLLRDTFGLSGRWADEDTLQRAFVIVLLTVLPIGLYLVRGEPVALLKSAGAIEAAHIPFLAALTLYLNRQRLPKELQPSRLVFGLTAAAGLFFAVFAVAYVIQLLSGGG